MNIIDFRYRLLFTMKKATGKGQLVLFDADALMFMVAARSGSIKADGGLQNCVAPVAWYLRSGPEIPVKAEEDTMFVKSCPGKPWKIPLWSTDGNGGSLRTHFLIHPDGSLNHSKDGNGTNGCIGTATNAEALYDFFKVYDFANYYMKLEIRVEE